MAKILRRTRHQSLAGKCSGRGPSRTARFHRMYRIWYTSRVPNKPEPPKGAKGTAMNARKNRKKMDHSGSTFDSFLEAEGIREELEAVAIKRVLAWQLQQAMREQQKTKRAMAKQLHTSRSQ